MTTETKTYPPLLPGVTVPKGWVQLAVGDEVTIQSKYRSRGTWWGSLEYQWGNDAGVYNSPFIRPMTYEEICAEVVEECCRNVCVSCAKGRPVSYKASMKYRHEKFVHRIDSVFELECRAWAIREHFYREEQKP